SVSFFQNNEIILADKSVKVIKQENGVDVPYQVHSIGLYVVVEAENGLILMWDKKNSLFIKLSSTFQGQVCGLCGNYDGNGKNDFTSRNQEVVVDALEFGNSWKVSTSCPNADVIKNPCALRSYRESWSLKRCSIITSKVFAACHSEVDPTPFHDACVRDSCACDTGGDCECFCTAVAAYAQACNEAGACIRWRTPDICPVFCDFYNPIGECEWHYQPCGDPCMKTCRNPSGTCSSQIPALEGCYPKCPPDQPYLEESTMKCVPITQCGCYDGDGTHYNEDDVIPSKENCQRCLCSSTKANCSYDIEACHCIYNGSTYPYGAIVYNTTDVKVYDESGCCYRYECQCICYGWGDPHYVTFDGQYYSFQENCTYVLIKEIVPRYNFSVNIDNYNCDPSGHVTCPQSLIVHYKSYIIVLTPKRSTTTKNVVYINGNQIFPTFSNEDLMITSTGIELLLTIPAIKAQVMFKSLMYSVTLPNSLFHNNTEGQCGTCDNIRKNDCRLPNGQIDPSCPGMAHQWQIPDDKKPYCKPKSPTPSTTTTQSTKHTSPTKPMPPSTPTPTPPTCPSGKTAICDIILSPVFEQCHDVIPPRPFFEACKFDVCHMPNITIGCSSLETYAVMCAGAGVCINWRNSTNGKCELICPKTKVYKACGPTIQPTCNSRYNDKYVHSCEGEQNSRDIVCDTFMEGCFCPEATILFNTLSDTCVRDCGCTGPDGNPKQFGETWNSNCQKCECNADTLSVRCEPVKCQHQEVVTCKKYGEVLVNKTVDCCQINTCVPKPVCVHNNTEFTLGEIVPSGICEECKCGPKKDPVSELYVVECVQIDCSTTCQTGYEYEVVPGECCGTCVQKECVVALPNATSHIIQLGEFWSPPSDRCVKYDCTKRNDQFIVVKTKLECPVFSPEDCVPGTEKTDANGCCTSCTPISHCDVKNTTTYLVKTAGPLCPWRSQPAGDPVERLLCTLQRKTP
ncbi:hypothetical protein J4Q44_G00110020, partial [Coregonus suidteri]